MFRRTPLFVALLHSSCGAMLNSTPCMCLHCSESLRSSHCFHLLETVYTHVSLFHLCHGVLSACCQCFFSAAVLLGPDRSGSSAPASAWVCSSQLVLHHTVSGAGHLAGTRVWRAGCCCLFVHARMPEQSPLNMVLHMFVSLENQEVGWEAAPWGCRDIPFDICTYALVTETGVRTTFNARV